MEPVKLEKLEAVTDQQADAVAKVATVTAAQRDAAALAGYLRLPLETIDAWSLNEKHSWLKCMLTKHFNSQPMDESHSKAILFKLAAIDSVMLERPNLTLDSLLDLVEIEVDCLTAEKLRGELAVWRQASRIESLSRSRPCSRQLAHQSAGSGDLLWQHILRMLMTRDPAVRWLQPQLGHFQFVRSGAAAKSWGRTKNNENMSFEKMSRSIRQYYRQKPGVIQKVPSKARLQYQFNMRHPEVVRFLLENFPEMRRRQ